MEQEKISEMLALNLRNDKWLWWDKFQERDMSTDWCVLLRNTFKPVLKDILHQ